jgi:glutathione S-transferase
VIEALKFVEAHLAKEKETGRYCHGDQVTLADICIAHGRHGRGVAVEEAGPEHLGLARSNRYTYSQ